LGDSLPDSTENKVDARASEAGIVEAGAAVGEACVAILVDQTPRKPLALNVNMNRLRRIDDPEVMPAQVQTSAASPFYRAGRTPCAFTPPIDWLGADALSRTSYRPKIHPGKAHSSSGGAAGCSTSVGRFEPAFAVRFSTRPNVWPKPLLTTAAPPKQGLEITQN
jgi:hypothetical protein